MSVEFRQRSVGEMIAMIGRHKWLIILPTLAITAAVGYVVYSLPAIYESTSLLTVKPPTISRDLVTALTSEDLSQSLRTMNQEVLSRSSLEPMIMKYDLYATERNAGTPMELVVQKMYKAIEVEVQEGGDQKVAAFKIRYRYRDPQSTRNVVAELASKYVNAQIQKSNESAVSTKELFDKQLEEKKVALDDLSKQRLDIMSQNVASLPESEQGLVAQLQGLRQKDDQISKDKDTLVNEKGRYNDQIAANNRQMRLIEDFGQRDTNDAVRDVGNLENSPAYLALIQKRSDLNSQLEALLKVYKEKNPQVGLKRLEITNLNKEIDELKRSSASKVDVAKKDSEKKTELQRKSLELENQKLQSQIAGIDQQMASKDTERLQNAGQISALESRINSIPNVKVALEGLNAQYQSAKQSYDEILKKKNDAETVVGVEANAQGETIRVQDPANIPQLPVAPKRFLFTLAGAGIGLFIGLFLAALLEIPKLFKIQNIQDAKHYTGLPVLASVPPLLSTGEKQWIRRSQLLKLAGGVIAAIGIVPVLIFILQQTRLLDRLVS